MVNVGTLLALRLVEYAAAPRLMSFSSEEADGGIGTASTQRPVSYDWTLKVIDGFFRYHNRAVEKRNTGCSEFVTEFTESTVHRSVNKTFTVDKLYVKDFGTVERLPLPEDNVFGVRVWSATADKFYLSVPFTMNVLEFDYKATLAGGDRREKLEIACLFKRPFLILEVHMQIKPVCEPRKLRVSAEEVGSYRFQVLSNNGSDTSLHETLKSWIEQHIATEFDFTAVMGLTQCILESLNGFDICTQLFPQSRYTVNRTYTVNLTESALVAESTTRVT